MLSVSNLKSQVGSFELAVDDFTVPSGELLSVLGVSGSGKSTLLNVLAGFLPMVSGTINVGETNVADLRPEHRKIGVVFQRAALFPHLSVRQNIEFPLKVQKRSDFDEQVQVWLRRLGIEELDKRLPHEISEGQAQRVAIARAFITGFSTILMDEPFSALDTETRASLRDELRTLVTETQCSVLMVSHHLEDAKAISDSVMILNQGRTQWQGSVTDWDQSLRQQSPTS